MLKFIAGVVLGAVMSFFYVNHNVTLPAFLQLPQMLRGNLISTATEATLYDLDAKDEERARALEVFFGNRAADAARLDAAAGHPFVAALHRERAARQARQLSMSWGAFDEALAKDALRKTLETKHGTSDSEALKRAMLMDALERKPFLKQWLERANGPVRAETLRDLLKAASAYPDVLKSAGDEK